MMLALESAPKGAEIIVWTIYENPADYPGKVVVRPHFIVRGEAQPVASAQCWEFATIEDAREALPEDLTLLLRDKDDDPAIAEVWL